MSCVAALSAPAAFAHFPLAPSDLERLTVERADNLSGVLLRAEPAQAFTHPFGRSVEPATWPRTQPAIAPAQSPMMGTEPGHPAEPHVRRRGMVRLDAGILLSRSAKGHDYSRAAPSQVYLLQLFEDRVVDVVIERDLSPPANAVALHGYWGSNPAALVSITITPQSYLLSIEDPDRSTLYRVVGNTFTGLGRILEIDYTSMPAMIPLPPLRPAPDL